MHSSQARCHSLRGISSGAFKRAQIQHSVSMPLYDCSSGSAVKVSRTLDFLYGYVQSGHYGWIAMPNLSTTQP